MTVTEFFEKAREILNEHDGNLKDNVDYFTSDMDDLLLEWNDQEQGESNNG